MGRCLTAEINQDGESADIHKGVGEQIEHDARNCPVSLSAYAGDKTDKDITHMGDGGIGQHSFDVGLGEGCKVAHRHGKYRKYSNKEFPLVTHLGHSFHEDSDEGRKTGRFGTCRHERCYWSGRSLIYVRGPLVKRHH